MTEFDIQKFGEIQYLKGRLDELNKAYPTVTNMERRRKLDQRLSKYYEKLKKIDEVAYHLYIVEVENRIRAKEKSKKEIKDLLEEIVSREMSDGLIEKVKNQIDKY